MKSETLAALEHAAWPVLLVDASATVRRANEAAVNLFGAGLDGEPSLGAGLWSSDNGQTPAEFLSRMERAPAQAVPLRWRAKGGNTLTFQTYFCAQTREGEKSYLFQLLAQTDAPVAKPHPPPPPSGHIPIPPAPAGGSGGTVPGLRTPPTAVESLIQKQKLDCALQLTRTVALDFNNALTSILGHTSLVLSKMPQDHPWRNSLLEVEKSAEKAAEIAHDLAAFSRQEKESGTQVAGNLNDLLRRTVTLFKASTGANLEWQVALESQVYSVKFDEAKIQQAFVKVIENAMQAVGGSGQIQVRTRNLDLTEPRQDRAAQLAAGQYVQVEIKDNGPGIPPEVMPRIFEPFFTTKKSPAHRGLGLAWVYGIVTNHGGSVAISSQPGEGASVRVYLPAQKQLVKDRTLKTDDLTGNQTVLMVDDEDLVLTMGETILGAFGYRVLTANSGAKALEIFAAARDKIDLVITDLVMPNMSGRELIERLRALAPTLRLICSSGYLRSPTPEEEVGYLKKPFTSQDLLRKVKQALQ